MFLIFHKTDQLSIRKHALILFVINLSAWSIVPMGKSLHLPRMVLIVFFSIYLVGLIALLIYIYRFLDPKDKYRPLHPGVAELAPELRSGILGLYMHSLLFSILPLNIFGNLLGLKLNSFLDIVIYMCLCALMAWGIYHMADLNKIKNTITNKSPNNSTAISDEKAANFFIIGYILVMVLIAFLLYKNTV